MANPFYKAVKKIGEFFGFSKAAKEAAGLSDEEYNAASDYIDNHSDKEIDSLISSNPLGKTVINTRDDPLGIGRGFNWIKGQIESSTGQAANETNKEIAGQNMDFEREKFEYDKALQRELFEREDTANQRTVNDMRMAGLNPLNMQGTNSAGDVVSTSAPHNDFQMQSTQTLQLIDTLFNSALQAKATQSNNSLQSANANLLNAQADNQRIKNTYEADILASALAGSNYDNQLKFMNNINKQDDYFFNRLMGWTENMPDWLKQSSGRFGWRPFDSNLTFKEWNKGMKDPLNSYFRDKYKPNFYGNQEISQNLLSDELLMGSLGIFGNILKLLVK